jgi:hypothetical protein
MKNGLSLTGGKIEKLLREEGYSLIETDMTKQGGSGPGSDVYRYQYQRGDGERVFVFIHEPSAVSE